MSLRPSDTSPEAHAAQICVYRMMTSEQRMGLGIRLAEEGREIARAGVRSRHPEYDAEQVEDAVRVLYLGPDLFRAAWPHRPIPHL